MARLLAQAASPSVQAASPSAQAKAAAAQVGDRNWNWRKNLSCPTIGVDNPLEILSGSQPEAEKLSCCLMNFQLRNASAANVRRETSLRSTIQPPCASLNVPWPMITATMLTTPPPSMPYLLLHQPHHT